MRGPSTPSPTRVSWKPLVLKSWPFFPVSCGNVVDWPHVAEVRFWRPKRPHLEKRHAIWRSPSSCDKHLRTFHNTFFFALYGSKSGILGQNRCLGVFWTECGVADLKQRQRITSMDRRNKIQSLALPTDDPGDAPDCITECGPCTDRSEVWGFPRVNPRFI